MLVTEKTAKTLVCPFITYTGDMGSRNCQGPNCMAWRPVWVAGYDDGGYCGIAGQPTKASGAPR